MSTVIIILAVIVAVFLTIIVLIQESKGGGLASDFASSNQIMGVRKTTDFVEKATWTLAGLLVLLSVVFTYVAPRGNNESSVVTNMRAEAPAALPGQNQQQVSEQPNDAAPAATDKNAAKN